MHRARSRTTRSLSAVVLGTAAAWIAVLAFAETAWAIPTFSRKYRTSCTTCHTIFPKLTDAGEAFRRNGYQFPRDDEILVRDEPVPMGSEAYKDMFPNSIWPSDMPTLPPVFIRAQQRNILHTDPGPNGVKWDMDFPHELVLGGAGTFGEDISAWWEIEWEPSEDEVAIERAFVQFSNLFAWDLEEDEDGMRPVNRWMILPPHALNLRLGKMEPQVLPHVVSQHARVGVQQALPIRQRIGANQFRFEPVQSAAVELHGIVRQYNSYVIGYANGGAVSGGHLDDNTHKDFYFRVARKWFGYPLDGVLGGADVVGNEASVSQTAYRGQEPAEEVESGIIGLDFWRAWGFETGLFGWFGEAEIANNPIANNDNFERIGFDARLQWFDFDVYGLAYWGQDDFAGLVNGVNLGNEEHFSWFVQTDYMFKPWMLGFLRYEETDFNEGARTGQEEGRIVPGMVFLIRQNMKLQTEWVLDTLGNDNGGGQATDRITIQLDYAY